MNIKFECLTGSIDSFEVLQNKTKFPNKECSICLQDYLPHVKVQLLPCSHLFHRHCIQAMQKNNPAIACPFDQQPIQWAQLTMLGQKVLFKHESTIWIYHLLEKYQEVLIDFLQESQENSKQSELCEKSIKTFVAALQRFADDYEQRNRLQTSDFFPFDIPYDTMKNMILRIEKKEEAIYLAFDLEKLLMTDYNEKASDLLKILLSQIPPIGDLIKTQLITDIAMIFYKLIWDNYVSDPSLQEQRNHQFYISHYQAWFKLGIDINQQAYLNQISDKALERLNILAKKQTHLSHFEKQVQMVYKQKQDNKLKIQKIMLYTLGALYFIAYLFYQLPASRQISQELLLLMKRDEP